MSSKLMFNFPELKTYLSPSMSDVTLVIMSSLIHCIDTSRFL